MRSIPRQRATEPLTSLAECGPPRIVVPAARSARRALAAPHRRTYQAVRLVLRPFLRMAFEMVGRGEEHIPRSGPYLLAYNHVSMLDWAFACYFLPEPVRFVVDRDYFDLRLLRPPMRIVGAIPAYTDRPDLTAYRRARAVLAAGDPLVLTPEGRISRTGRPGAAQPGIVALAAAQGVPILPAAIRGAFEVFPRHRRLPRPGHVSVTFGRLLPPPAAQDRAAQRALAGRLITHITALLDGVSNPEPPW